MPNLKKFSCLGQLGVLLGKNFIVEIYIKIKICSLNFSINCVMIVIPNSN